MNGSIRNKITTYLSEYFKIFSLIIYILWHSYFCHHIIFMILRNRKLGQSHILLRNVHSVLSGIFNNLRYADDTTLMAESEEELKSLLMKVKEGKKVGLKLNIQNMKTMASNPITSWKIDKKQWKQWQTLFSWASKSLWMETATMKLKDSCSLERKLWQT